MIHTIDIPLELTAARLAEASDMTPARAGDALDRIGRVNGRGAFLETETDRVAEPHDAPTSKDWGPRTIVGLCRLETSSGAWPPDPDPRAAADLALGDALDFMTYRIGQYLKPAGRRPGPRLLPGCPQLPLVYNARLLEFFQPEHRDGLRVDEAGNLYGPPAVLFLHPENPAAPGGVCAHCAKTACPSRAH